VKEHPTQKHILLVAACLGLSAGAAAADCVQITEGLVVESPVWSPDGTTLAFHSGIDIYTVPATGGPVTHVIENAQWPTWSPDGTRLAFARAFPPGVWDIWVLELSTGALQQITTSPRYDTHPDWSHDGDKIVYKASRIDHDALYVYSFSTGLHTRLTSYTGESPDWAPNDERIVFERHSFPEGPDIMLVDYPSGDEQRIFWSGSGYYWPRWHPSGESLILIGLDDIALNPCVVSYPLPSGPRLDLRCRSPWVGLSYPEWAPDGSRYSVVEAGDLTICDQATAVQSETWGTVKSRYRSDRE